MVSNKNKNNIWEATKATTTKKTIYWRQFGRPCLPAMCPIRPLPGTYNNAQSAFETNKSPHWTIKLTKHSEQLSTGSHSMYVCCYSCMCVTTQLVLYLHVFQFEAALLGKASFRINSSSAFSTPPSKSTWSDPHPQTSRYGLCVRVVLCVIP